MPSKEDFTAEFVQGIDAQGQSIGRMVITFYTRVMWQAIHDQVAESISREIAVHLSQNEEFRSKVRAEIQGAVAGMPLDAITRAVKEAISEVVKQEKLEAK